MDVIFLFEHAQLNLPGIISMGHCSLQAVWKGGGVRSSAAEEKLPIPGWKLYIGKVLRNFDLDILGFERTEQNKSQLIV